MRQPWRPREGKSLSEQPMPGTMQRKILSLFARVPKVFLYPVWGIVVAALITFSGRAELQLRSYGLVLIAMWLVVDLWAWLLPKNTRWRFVVGWSGASVLLIGVMVIMWWWLDGKLKDQRDDVFAHLTPNHNLVLGEEDDPMHTMFTVSNNSAYDISRRHGITCFTNFVVGNSGTSYNRWTASWIDNGSMVFSGTVHTFDRPPASSPLLAGGDATTDPCLKTWGFVHGTDCADITLIFWYTLENQPDFKQEKKFRFIANKGKTGEFSWVPEPLESRDNYCLKYYRGAMPP